MSHVSDFTQEEDKIILDLVNYDNATNFTLAELSTANPVVQDNKVRVRITPVQGTGYGGLVDVVYKRLNIGEFIDLFRPDGLVLQQGDAVNTVDFLEEINALLGTNIKPSHVVSQPIGDWTDTPNETKEVSLIMNANSKVYEGQAWIIVDGNDIPLASAVSSNILNGLHLPVHVDSVDYQPMIDDMLYPFEANTTQTEQEILQQLHNFLGLTMGDLSFAPGTVFPSFEEPERKVILRSNNPMVRFSNSSETEIELGLGRYQIPNAEFPSLLSNGAQWTWNEGRGWYNDIQQPDTGTTSLIPIPALARFFKRLRALGGNFTQHPTLNSNGLGSNYLNTLQGTTRIRVGTWDQYNGVTDQWIYADNKEFRQPGNVINQVYRLTLPPPAARADVTSIEVSSAWRSGYNKGVRGMKDIFVEMYVTRASAP